MERPDFSVIVPVFKRVVELSNCLDSVASQTNPNFECIVVDDGSPNASEIKRLVTSRGDARFRYVLRENGGGGAARNTGIDLARGQYIAFLDSDDLFLPHKLKAISERLPADRRVVLYSQNKVLRAKGGYWLRPSRAIGPAERVAEYMFINNNFIQTSTIVIETEFARQVRFDDGLRKGQDLDFCLRLASAGAEFEMYPEPLSIWNDVSEAGRTSRERGYEQPEHWLRSHEHLLTSEEIAGFRATSLAYYYGWHRPGAATSAIIGGLSAGVPLPILVRQFGRTFLPRAWYRSAVDSFVKLFGDSA